MTYRLDTPWVRSDHRYGRRLRCGWLDNLHSTPYARHSCQGRPMYANVFAIGGELPIPSPPPSGSSKFRRIYTEAHTKSRASVLSFVNASSRPWQLQIPSHKSSSPQDGAMRSPWDLEGDESKREWVESVSSHHKMCV